MKKLAAGLLLAVSLPLTAFAVGDPQQVLNAEEAKSIFAKYQVLLSDGCPDQQVAVSGTINGGASPAGGSRTIVINFDAGATVIIEATRGLINGGGRRENRLTARCTSGNE